MRRGTHPERGVARLSVGKGVANSKIDSLLVKIVFQYNEASVELTGKKKRGGR